jgi:hypothetical protein
MEHFIFISTRIILIACILVIGYLIAIPEKDTAEEWDV